MIQPVNTKGVSYLYFAASDNSVVRPTAFTSPANQQEAVRALHKQYSPEFDYYAAKPYLHPPGADIVHMIARRGKNLAHYERPAFLMSQFFQPDGKTEIWNFRRLYGGIKKTVAAMQDRGLREGDTIAIADMNTSQMLITNFAGWAAGLQVVPLNLLALQDKATKTDKMLHMLTATGAKALFVGDSPDLKAIADLASIQKLRKYDLTRGLLERFVRDEPPEIMILENMFRSILTRKLSKGDPALLEEKKESIGKVLDILPRDFRVIGAGEYQSWMRKPLARNVELILHPEPTTGADVLLTSGTSGLPKGVSLTHENLVFTAGSLQLGTNKNFRHPDETWLIALPLFHTFGKSVFLSVMSGGLPSVLIPNLRQAFEEMDKVVDTIEQYDVSVIASVPKLLEALVVRLEKHPEDIPRVQSLRHIISGGDVLQRETFEKLKTFVPHLEVNEGYGSSEGGINLFNYDGKYGGPGKPFPGVEARIDDPDETGQGELVVGGPGVSPGYLPETLADPSSQEAFVNDEYHTGDLVRYKPEEAGGYQITGRNGDFIKISGERRSPRQLEDAVIQSGIIPDLEHVMVAAYKPDRENEHAVAVIAGAGDKTDKDVRHTMMRRAGDGQIAWSSVPRFVICLQQNELPHGFIGFKRQYAAARDFISKAVEQGVVTFEVDEHADSPINKYVTRVDQAKMAEFAKTYQFNPKKK